MTHLLFRASLEGRIVRGPVAGAEQRHVRGPAAAAEQRHVRGPAAAAEQRYVLVSDWLPSAADEVARIATDRDRALRELALRYLAGHGPADARDLAKWAGLTLRDARAGLGALSGRLRERDGGLVELAGRPQIAEPPGPRLLGAFEPLLMGWCSREGVLGQHDPRVVSGGIFRAFAFVFASDADHSAGPVGTWKFGRDGVELSPFDRLDDRLQDALGRDGQALLRFLGRA
jgi:hypothetical protein